MLFCKMVQETWSRSLVVPLTSSFCMKNNSFFRTNSPIYFWNFFYPENNWSPNLPNVVASIGCRTYISQVLTPFLDQFLISQGSKTFIFQVWLLRLQFFYHNSIFLNNNILIFIKYISTANNSQIRQYFRYRSLSGTF